MEKNTNKRGGTANSVPVCDCNVTHPDVIAMIEEIMPDANTFILLTSLFKAFGDNTRLRILFSLAESEMCVCDIASLLGMTQSAISHQLRVLKNTGLVKYEKRGKSVYYSLDDDHVRRIFKQGLQHVAHRKYETDDIEI